MPTPLPEPTDLNAKRQGFYDHFVTAQDRRRKIEAEDAMRPIQIETAKSLNALRNMQAKELENKNALSQFEYNKAKREDEIAGKKEVVGNMRLMSKIEDATEFSNIFDGHSQVLYEKFGVPVGTIPPSEVFLKVDKNTGKKVIDKDRYNTFLSDAATAVGAANAPQEGTVSIQWVKNEDTGKVERVEFVHKNGQLVRNKVLAMSPKEEAELAKTKAETKKAETGKSGKFYNKTYYDENGILKTVSVPEGENFTYPAGSRLPSEVPAAKVLSKKELLTKSQMILNQPQSQELDIEADEINNTPGVSTFYLPVKTKFRNKMLVTGMDLGSAGEENVYKPITISKDPEINTYRPFSYFKRIADTRGMDVTEVIKEYNNFVKQAK